MILSKKKEKIDLNFPLVHAAVTNVRPVPAQTTDTVQTRCGVQQTPAHRAGSSTVAEKPAPA